MNCYRFQQENYNQGFLDGGISATYIIHLEGNGRLAHVKSQLARYHPSKIVYILFNKGYKECAKNLRDNVPPVDLVDAYRTVMEHAEAQHYQNILVLEDDFIFDEKILEEGEHTGRILTFLKEHSDTSFTYSLGCLPILQVPTPSYYTRQTLLNCGTHSVIYTEKCRKQVLRDFQEQRPFFLKEDWDIYTNHRFVQYMYYIPLCYQLFKDTENQRHWIYIPGITELALFYFKRLNMDVQPEPGFSIMYYLSFWLFFVMVLLVGYLVHSIYIWVDHQQLKSLILKGYKKNFSVLKIA